MATLENNGSAPLAEGTLSFTVESRLLRELGERLVKQPEVALVELIKNSYDADARTCTVTYEPPQHVTVADDGRGMTLSEFTTGWMRIGTSAKAGEQLSRRFKRVITGEKGIGRFAVRFLGMVLELRTVAEDGGRGFRTLLTAHFDWPAFDRIEDIDQVRVPYTLTRATDDPVGTSLRITSLRPATSDIDLGSVRTASISVVSPFNALLRAPDSKNGLRDQKPRSPDPGFSVRIHPVPEKDQEADVASAVLRNAVLRAVVELDGDKLSLRVYRRTSPAPVSEVVDKYENSIRNLYADIRFFPKRKGSFADLPVDGRVAKRWVNQHSGVAVFDRAFRVLPYGTPSDDWLFLAADTARRARDPRSSLAKKHFPMDEPTRTSTQLNYMLRLPYPEQLIGAVQVQGRRATEQLDGDEGLIAAADREGFVDNTAFQQLRDIVRGAVEAIASADRELQQEQERLERQEALRALRAQTRAAIQQIESNPHIRSMDKHRIIKQLSQAHELAEQHEERAREREQQLEIMSLLGVVAGFMTHEFGTALDQLDRSHRELVKLSKKDESFMTTADALQAQISTLREFVTYSQGYIQGAASRPTRPYAARPRIQQVVRVFGKYARERGIDIEIDVDADVMSPLVPVSLYNGLVLNLYTNALKAVIAKSGSGGRLIKFHARNDRERHYLEVLDTGIGIPIALRTRIFDPLFTTTASHRDPLGSGMGLGLSLVKRSVESYGGRVDVVDPPREFATCVRLRLPLAGD